MPRRRGGKYRRLFLLDATQGAWNRTGAGRAAWWMPGAAAVDMSRAAGRICGGFLYKRSVPNGTDLRTLIVVF